jgi:putative ABC transport system permease protein
VKTDYLELSYVQIALAAALVLLNGAVSVLLRLRLEMQLLLASVRMVVQLLLVGLVLKWVFDLNEPSVVLLMAAGMAIIAGVAALGRTRRRYPGIWLDTCLSIWATSWLITGVALFGIVQVEPWYKPQYAIPLLGMILGNTLNGISLGLDRFNEELMTQRSQVETLLALGATRWEAARLPLQQAVRTGMIPMINAMMVAGVVSLPGMMTGQLLSGVDPLEAVKYQIVILFLIAAATALGTISVILLAYRRLFNSRHQFQSWLLRNVNK